MKLEIFLTNNFNNPDDTSNIDFSNYVCAVIDVIRATSTIATILGRNADSIIIAKTKEQALRLKEYFKDHILCGEEYGLPPEGFDYDNSPLELSNLNIRGKKVILKTTNGTKSFLKAQKAKAVFSLSIVNLNYTLDCMLDYVKKSSGDILLLCSGKTGEIAYDDAYTAGLAVKYLLTRPISLELSDSAKLVLSAALSEKNILDALQKSSSAHALKKIGSGDDLKFCSKLNRYNVTGKLEIMDIGDFKKGFKYGRDNNKRDIRNKFKFKSLLVIKPYII